MGVMFEWQSSNGKNVSGAPSRMNVLVLHGKIMREREKARTGHSHDHRPASICRGTHCEHEEEDARRLDCRKAERYLLKIREVG